MVTLQVYSCVFVEVRCFYVKEIFIRQYYRIIAACLLTVRVTV